MKSSAVGGVAHHNGWAILVTATLEGNLVDRRRVELVDEELPCMPYHCEGQGLPINKAVRLVEKVEASANLYAKKCLEKLSASIPNKIIGIALRKFNPLPETVKERIQNYQAMCVADSVMYRDALAKAARREGGPFFGMTLKPWLMRWGRCWVVMTLKNFFRSLENCWGRRGKRITN